MEQKVYRTELTPLSFLERSARIFPDKIAIEPDRKLKSCAEDNHMGKRMFEKHLAIGEAYQASAAKVAQTGLAEAGVRLAMILNDAAKASN